MNEVNLAAMFAAYPNARVLLQNQKEPCYANGIIKPTWVRVGRAEFNLKYSQIELTPLSLISDEHAIEVAKIAKCDMDNAVKDGEGDGYFIVRDEFGIHLRFWYKTSYEYDEWDVYPFTIHLNGDTSDYMGVSTNQIQIIDYLRSKSYDCGYMNLPSLIASGHAVETSK